MDLTNQANDMIEQAQTAGQTHEGMMILVMALCLVVTIFALGLDFWRNWFNIIFFPRVTFTRLAGEQQVLPAIFVVLFFAFISTIIAIHYWSMPIVKAGYLEILEEQLNTVMGSVPEIPGADFRTIIDDTMSAVEKDVNANLAALAVIPLEILIFWFFAGMSFWLVGKVLGKGSGGLVNYLCGISYFFWIHPLITLGHWWGYLPNLTTIGQVFIIVFLIALVLYLIFTMRDYMHCSWINAIVGVVILAPIFTVILLIVFAIIVVMIFTYIQEYV